MSNTAKVSISIPDEELLRWAKERSRKSGVSLSALFAEALRLERQMEARRAFLAELGADAVPSPEEAAAIRAEWGTPQGAATVPRPSRPGARRKATGAGRKRSSAGGGEKR